MTRPTYDELVEALDETVRVLRFAFIDGALPHETVMGLCIDPYGLLADAESVLSRTKDSCHE